MKKLIVLLVLLFAFSQAAWAEEVIKVTADPWPPWIMGKEGKEPEGGIAFKTINEIAGRLGFKTAITVYPFARALKNVVSGEADMILMVSKNPEREETLIFTEKIFDSPYLIFFDSARISDFSWKTYEDLKPFKVGVVRSYNYGAAWSEGVKKYDISIDVVTDDATNLKKLIRGRIDCALLQKENARYMIHNNPEYFNRIKFNVKPVSNTPFYFAVSKKSSMAEMVPLINREILRMRRDGTIDKIIDEVFE